MTFVTFMYFMYISANQTTNASCWATHRCCQLLVANPASNPKEPSAMPSSGESIRRSIH